MRTLIWLLLLFGAAVLGATLLGANDAMVTLYYRGWRTDLSLNLFLLLLLATFAALHVALRVLDAVATLPVRAHEWRELKRERAAQQALREALFELLGGRYARGSRAAQRAVELCQGQADDADGARQTAVLAHIVDAWAAHRLQDRPAREQRVQAALALSQVGGKRTVSSDAVQMLAAEWALDDRDGERSAALLAELPAGVSRRTHALRLKLQTQRLLDKPLDSLQTARLLAKHQAFSPQAARALLRILAQQALATAYDEEQLRRTWAALDAADRRDVRVVAQAARHAAKLGLPALGREWIATAWDGLPEGQRDERAELASAVIACLDGLGSDWLGRIESALQGRSPPVPPLQALAGLAWAERRLWGKAQGALEQAAAARTLEADIRRHCLRALAQIAREKGDEALAAQHEHRAAGLD